MKFKKTAAVLGATALISLANPAMAAGPVWVDVTGSPAGTYNWTATSKGAIVFKVHHGAGVVNMGCASATAAGTIKDATTTTGLAVGNIGSTAWGIWPTTACVGPGGIPMKVTQLGAAPGWDLNIDLTPKPTHPLADTLTGNIGNVIARVESKVAGLCKFDVTGAADIIFRERVLKSAGPPAVYAQELEVNETSGNLVLSNVSGCLGAVANGDTADFQGIYNVTSPSGDINFRPVP